MSGNAPEPTVRDRIAERPSFEPAKVRKARPRDLLIRFFAGGLTSIVAGALTLAFGARVGGIMLGFPAILAASLTLIEEQEDSVQAREDARGAMAGGSGMAAFALAATLTFGHVGAALALLIAAGAWALTSLTLYLILWFR